MDKQQLQLRRALDQRQLIRFSRRFDASGTHGYVRGFGAKFLLLALVADGQWFNGFECVRIKDVRNLRPDPYRAFAEAALRKRGERLPRKPRIAMGSIEEILLSANRAFPLVTIHQERVHPDICWIGRVLCFDRGQVAMLEITPGAKWESKPRWYRLSTITRVDFGGGYEEALHLVGGSPSDSVVIQAKRSSRRS